MTDNRELDQLTRAVADRQKFFATISKTLRDAARPEERDAVAISRTLHAAAASPFVDEGLRSELDQAIIFCDRELARGVLELESRVRDLCEGRGWRVDGQWPTLYVERAVELEFDAARTNVRVAGAKVSSIRTNAIGEALAEKIKDLLPRAFSPVRFAAQIYGAYNSVSKTGDGLVPVLDLYRAIVVESQSQSFWRNARTAQFKQLTLEQFRARITRMLEHDSALPLDGKELRLYPPLDPKSAIFMYLPADGRFGFVGRVEFRTVERETT